MEEILVRIIANLQASCQVCSRRYAHKKALFPGQPPSVHHCLLSGHCDSLVDDWDVQDFRYKSWPYSLDFMLARRATWRISMCRYNFRDCDSYSKYCILLSHCSRLPKDYFELTAVSYYLKSLGFLQAQHRWYWRLAFASSDTFRHQKQCHLCLNRPQICPPCLLCPSRSQVLCL